MSVRTEIEPRKVGAFRFAVADIRQMSGEEFAKQSAIRLEFQLHIVEPVATTLVGGGVGEKPERSGSDLFKREIVGPDLEIAVVGEHHLCAFQPGQVEGLDAEVTVMTVSAARAAAATCSCPVYVNGAWISSEIIRPP